MSLAVVLSGGGARGAYEAGVLSYLYEELAREGSWEPKIDIISGTSVGAINSAHLAANVHKEDGGTPHLRELWSGLIFGDVIRFGVEQLLGVPSILRGGSEEASVFDVEPLRRLVREQADWEELHRNICERGVLSAFTVTATDVQTGAPHCFVHKRDEVPLPEGLPRAMIAIPDRISAEHVLASAAIPILFPAVSIRGAFYCDGGLRFNTPLSPAVRMGAEKVLIVALNTRKRPLTPALMPGQFPSATFLLGKVLNAFLLDHLNNDLEAVGRFNEMIEDGMRAYGPGFLDKVNASAEARGGLPRRLVKTCVIRPREDLGRLAERYLARLRDRLSPLRAQVLSFLDMGEGREADLASYLLFDGEYAQALIERGWEDAALKRESLLRFLSER